MKQPKELRETPRLLITKLQSDGGYAEALLNSSEKKNRPATIVFSWEYGWDHVSVSFPKRCPTWEEMDEIKRMFFNDDEICVQYHPARKDHRNLFPFCLHIWRDQSGYMIAPPGWMVAPKEGQSTSDFYREIAADIDGKADRDKRLASDFAKDTAKLNEAGLQRLAKYMAKLKKDPSALKEAQGDAKE